MTSVGRVDRRDVSVFMYHSISDGAPPLCTPPTRFRDQLAVLADAGYRGVSVTDLGAWMRGEATLDDRTVVLTFDDGYTDFATEALPSIAAYGWRCTVFVPAGWIETTRPTPASATVGTIMTRAMVADLAPTTVDVGAHGMGHRDLTTLRPAVAEREISESRAILAEVTGRAITSFAAPYGRTTPALREVIRRHYDCAVGTTMQLVTRRSDRYDVPRIDMCYFDNLARWRAHLMRGPGLYFASRRLLRHARLLMPAPTHR